MTTVGDLSARDRDNEGNTILRVIVDQMVYPITLEILHEASLFLYHVLTYSTLCMYALYPVYVVWNKCHFVQNIQGTKLSWFLWFIGNLQVCCIY